MEKKWTLQIPNQQAVENLHLHSGIPKIYCQLLVNRGILSAEKAKTFFQPNVNSLSDPFLMKDMQKAVERIDKADSQKEKILVYGDYDVDGTTSVATVFSFLQEQYPTLAIDFYIPDRYKEGYGISKQGIEYAASQHIDLIIVLDCGIKAVEQIHFANTLGIEVIVCDHHLPGKTLPPAFAILNPKQKYCAYPYKELSGCGIGFKLICGIAQYKNLSKENAFKYLDLVAISTAADIVPMTGENRILAFVGLEKINKNPLPCVQALLKVSGLKAPYNIHDILFMLAPRINAAGRLAHAKIAVRLLIEKDSKKAFSMAEELHQLNDERKKLDRQISTEIIDRIHQDISLQNRKTTVMFQPHWHKGVIGIAASRVMESFYRPTVIFSEYNGKITGSARSVKGFNIYNALAACSEMMSSFGGHQFAAGMTLKKEMLHDFTEKFEEEVTATITESQLLPEIKIDAEITFKEITDRFYKTLARFEPFGPKNEAPVFLIKNVRDNGYSKILKTKHLRLEMIHPDFPGQSFTGIGFNLAHKFDRIASGKSFQLCFHLDRNHFNGKTRLQLRVLDLD